MPQAEEAALESGLRPSGFFAAAGRVGERNLGRGRKDRRIGKRLQQRLQKTLIDPHVIVEQYDDVRVHVL